MNIEVNAKNPTVTLSKSVYDALIKQNAELKAALNGCELRIKELSEENIKWKKSASKKEVTKEDTFQKLSKEFEKKYPDYKLNITRNGKETDDEIIECFKCASEMAEKLKDTFFDDFCRKALNTL